MPSLNSVLNNANTKNTTPQYSAVWVKTQDLGADGSYFCIDDIYPTKEPDLYGRSYWIVRAISPKINPENQRMHFKLPRSEKRDGVMQKLRNILSELKADDDNPDHALHGCFIEILPTTQKGMRDAYLLKALSDDDLGVDGCTCGFIESLDDHPF